MCCVYNVHVSLLRTEILGGRRNIFSKLSEIFTEIVENSEIKRQLDYSKEKEVYQGKRKDWGKGNI